MGMRKYNNCSPAEGGRVLSFLLALALLLTVSGGIAVRASGKGQTNLNGITADSVSVTACGLLCNYTADSDVVNSAVETVNVSPRGTKITVAFS